jgi:hypothetical protein
MAANSNGITDQDGGTSDWIEILNPLATGINLNGYYLTDDLADLTKWTFPDTNLGGGGYLVVFASGKDRAVAGQQLHTNFTLNADGEDLALVAPDGTTILSQYTYPKQLSDVAYGLAVQQDATHFLSAATLVKTLVPTDGSLGATWLDPAFDDTAWHAGTTGVGYETQTAPPQIPGFTVRMVDVNGGTDGFIDDISQAQSILNGTAAPGAFNIVFNGSTDYTTVNLGVAGGNFAGDLPLPNGFGGTGADAGAPQREDYALRATANVFIPAGQWSIDVGSDDGMKLTIPGISFTSRTNENFQGATNPSPANTIVYGGQRGHGHTSGVFTVPAGGINTTLTLDFYERGGGDDLELAIASGAKTFAVSPGLFALLKDGQNAWGVKTSSTTPPPSYTSLIGTDVKPQMLNGNTSAYMRMSFTVAGTDQYDTLRLRMKYDDGFVAYLNGQKIAERNAPANPVWNSTATASHPDTQALIYEDIDVPLSPGMLIDGVNSIAIQGLNDASDSPDFLIMPVVDGIQTLVLGERYFKTSTPGGPNNTGDIIGTVADTSFSVEHGFYDAPFDVTISEATAGAQIRYTIDGSAPTATTGNVYSGPIHIAATTTLRAAAFKPGLVSSRLDAATYLFLDDVLTQSANGKAPAGWPATWGANAVDYGMDPDIVNNATYKTTIKTDLKAIPTMSLVMNLNDLFDPSTGIYANPGGDGRGWERPASLELINPDGTKGFQADAGVRIRGGFSRTTGNPKHAFRLFFRSEYGDGTLNYPLFGSDGADSFDKFDLRTMQNYSWAFQGDPNGNFIQDQFSRDTQLAQGEEASHGNFYHLYINGQYWGLYNTDERPEAAFSASYFGGDKNGYDTIKVETQAGYTIEATDGDMNAWTDLWNQSIAGFSTMAAYQKAQGNNPDGSRNPAYANLLDVDNLIDYMLVILYTGNLDAPVNGCCTPNNWFGTRPRDGSNGFRFFTHDSEHSLLDVNADKTVPITAGQTLDKSNPMWIWQQLLANPEFRLRVADHIHDQFFNGGALTPAENIKRWLERKNEIDRAVVGESARWGDAQRPTTPLTRNDWVNAVTNIANNYFAQRTGVVYNQLQADGLYPSVAAPEFDQQGGEIPAGFKLNLRMPGGVGTIYYTLDGSDPRLLGGALSPTALIYTGPITLLTSATVNARVLSNVTWSALDSAAFKVDYSALKVSELMYNPAPPPVGSQYIADDYEFIEVWNSGATTLDLTGVNFSKGITFAFGSFSLPAGGRAVLAKNPAAFDERYGFMPAGAYAGVLSDSGEQIRLDDPISKKILDFTYHSSWYPIASGQGYSLILADPTARGGGLNDAAAWRPSNLVGGAPGAGDPGINPGTVVISEAMSNSTAPGGDFIELQNTTANPIDIGGWFLSDLATDLQKFQIAPGTMIGPNSFIVFTADEYGLAGNPGVNTPFDLSPDGTQIYLTNSNGAGQVAGYREFVDFAASDPDIAFGRYTKSTGGADFTALLSPTPGAANSGPLVGPVVISELMYHSQFGTPEFIELQNLSGADVPLYDPANPANTWMFLSGITFSFPVDSLVPALGYALVVPVDPATFRSNFNISPSVPIYGPYTGTLDNGGEDIKLGKPGTPAGNVVPYILVDKLKYGDSSPWPTLPDGHGASLSRISASAYGNDPANWTSAPNVGTPGAANPAAPVAPAFDLGADINVSQGGTFSRTINFTDPDLGQSWSGTANWGDGPVQQFLVININKSFALSHTYLYPGTYTVSVVLTDSQGASAVDTLVVTVLPSISRPGTAMPDQYAIRLDPTGVYTQFFENARLGVTPSFFIKSTAVAGMTFDEGAADDAFVVDLTNGNPVKIGGLTLAGSGQGTRGDLLRVIGGATGINVNISPTQVTVNNVTFKISGFEQFQVDGGSGDDTVTLASAITNSPTFNGDAGNDTLNVNAGTYTFTADAQLRTVNLSVVADNAAIINFNATQHLASLTLSGTSRATLSAGGAKLLRTSGLTLGPTTTLELNDNDLVIQSTPANKAALLTAITALLKTGRNGGAWNGKGIISSAAAVQPGHLTGLAIMLNDRGAGSAITANFDGEAVDANTILVKYTWNGDADLSGKIDADDYFNIDRGFANRANPNTPFKGYQNGDFDFSGTIDADDYFLADNAFVSQSGPLSSGSPAAATVAAATRKPSRRHHRHPRA